MTSKNRKPRTSQRSEPRSDLETARVSLKDNVFISVEASNRMIQAGIELRRNGSNWYVEATSPSPGSAPPATEAGSLGKPTQQLQEDLLATYRLKPWEGGCSVHPAFMGPAAATVQPAAEKRGRGRGRAPTMKNKLGACGTPGHAIYGSLVCSKCGLARRSAPSLPRRKR
jgi:hypothetical protein